jgi:hypothetical protein
MDATDREIPRDTADRSRDLMKQIISEHQKRRCSRGTGLFPANRVLVTEINDNIFKYAILTRKRDEIIVDSLGRLTAEFLSVDSLDPLDLHKEGVKWLQINSELIFSEVLVVSSNLEFFIRRIKFPAMRKKELYNAIKWETDKLIPIPVSQSYIKIKKDESRDSEVYVTVGAVPRPGVDKWEYLGSTLMGIAPVSAALVSVGPRSESEKSAFCYVYYNEDILNIGFYNAHGLQFSRPIQIRPDKLFDTGVPGTPIRRIVEELISGIEVFYRNFPDMLIDGLILLIPPSLSKPLGEAIAKRLEINIVDFDLSRYFKYDNKSGPAPDIEFLPLLGAARMNRNSFMFFPESLRRERKLEKLKRISRMIFLAGISIGIFSGIFWLNEIRIQQVKLGNLKKLRAEAVESDAYRQILDYRNRTAHIASLLNQFESNNNDHSKFLKILSSVTPGAICLESSTASRRESSININMAGHYDGDLSLADITIMRFMEALQARGTNGLRLQRLGQKLSGDRKTESFVLDGEFQPDG